MRIVSGFSVMVSETRYWPEGNQRVLCSAMAFLSGSVSSVVPSPRTPSERTFTQVFIGGRSRISDSTGGGSLVSGAASKILLMEAVRKRFDGVHLARTGELLAAFAERREHGHAAADDVFHVDFGAQAVLI